MSRLRGYVDLGALPRATPAHLLDDAALRRGRLAGEGLELAWDPAHVDVAASPQAMVFAAGRARHADRRTGERDAAWWLRRHATLGEAAPADVGGGFAVAIVDAARARVELFVDRFSIETLCWRGDGRFAAFADAACDVPGRSTALDRQALYDYMYLHAIGAPRTVYAGVQRLRAAHRVTFADAAERSDRYWSPAFVEDDRRDLEGRKRAFVAAVEKCVAEEADEPATACFLSGGTDSSTVAGKLARLRGGAVHAYSIGFDAQGYDEMEYARIAARHFGLVHHEHYVTPADLVDAMPKLAASFDQPFGNSSVLPAYLCAAKAHADGFTRLLAGDGGDELYGGNARYATQKLFELYHALPSGLRSGVLEPLATSAPFRTIPGLRQLGGYVRHSRLPMPERLGSFNLLDRIGQREFLDPDFVAAVDTAHPREEQRAVWQECDAASLLNRMLAFDWKYTLADSDLPKVRCATQTAGVGVGYPFLGAALTDLSLTVPPAWKLKRTKLRWFFKEALTGFLPEAILRKRKHGFGLPFGPWLLRNVALRAFVDDALAGVAVRGIVRAEALPRLMASLRQAPGYYGEMVWLLVMLEGWLRHHEAAAVRPAA